MSDLAHSFDRAAEEYERGRPSYPAGVLDLVELPATATVLDLAAGTGKLTRLLVSRYATVVAVEPLDGMRCVLEREVPEADALAGRAEAIPAADDEFDAVFVAQAFHWFASDAVVVELARVLRPRGHLILLWNTLMTAPITPPVPEEFRRRVRELREEAQPEDAFLDWREPLSRGPFGELCDGLVSHDVVLDAEGMLAQIASFSWVASRSDVEKRGLFADLRALLPEVIYTSALDTEVYWTRLR